MTGVFTAVVEVAGPFKIESEPVTVTVERLPEPSKKVLRTRSSKNLVAVLIIFLIAAVAVMLTRRRKRR